MICQNCNKEILEDSVFCPGCGYKLKQTADITTAKKKLNLKVVISISVVLIAALCVGIIVYYNSTPKAKYNKAEKAFAAGNYTSAIKYYTEAGDYEDATDKLAVAKRANHYVIGLNLIDQGYYDKAKVELEASTGYENALEKIQECDYNIAVAYMDKNNFLNAAKAFNAAGNYSDANAQIMKMGKELVEKANYSDAVTVFDYAKSWTGNAYAQYANGQVSLEKKEYSDAAFHFKRAGDIMDAPDLINACTLLIAKDDMHAGKLNTAKTELEELPSDFSYNDVSVASLLDQLNANSTWLALCGTWSNTSGEATTNCKARDYRYDGGTWSSTFDPGYYTLEITCVLNSDSTVSVTGLGTIFVFTDWSTIKLGLDYDRYHLVSFNKELSLSDLGKSISINDYTTITLGTDKITLNYNYKDDNSSVNFVYTYKTDVTYVRKTTK